KSAMKFVALPGADGRRRTSPEESVDHRIRGARNDQIFIERALQHARVGSPQNGVAALEIVGYTQARLELLGAGKPAIQIAAHCDGSTSVVSATGVPLASVQGEFSAASVSPSRNFSVRKVC